MKSLSSVFPSNEQAAVKHVDWTLADWQSEIVCLQAAIEDVQYQISELKDELEDLESDLEEAEEALDNCPDDDGSNEDED